MDSPNLLQPLAELTAALEKPEIQDQMSPAIKREIRSLSNKIRAALEEALGELTAPVLLSFYMGSAFQASLDKNDAIRNLLKVLAGEGAEPHPGVGLVVAYLARDLLAGEPVE